MLATTTPDILRISAVLIVSLGLLVVVFLLHGASGDIDPEDDREK